MFCNQCGKEIKEEWSACPYCGAVKLADIKKAQIQQKKYNKKFKKMIPYIIGGICVLILGKLFMGGGNNDASETYNESNESEPEVVEEVEEKEEYTIEEYLNSCEGVTLEMLARNPDQYIGRDIIVEGHLGSTFGVLHIGLWTSINPMTVEYDGPAYDVNLNPMGNIIDTDYGYVAGRLVDEDTIEAKIVIVTNANE